MQRIMKMSILNRPGPIRRGCGHAESPTLCS